ncbi:SH3 domain-containing protein [Streptomyces sp. N2A]|uniref:SH3 domain-containing protein n=1 Tax=Streptomyces sp. N2A TaxID=3073936 RepID=UPI00286FCC39|nr:SH3 domain-containing protein [Streptomyces sp. N2A]
MSIKHKLVAVGTAAGLIFGGGAAMASSASAASTVGAKACTFNIPNQTVKTSTYYNTHPKLRTGPGKGYGSKGTLRPADTVRVYCGKGNPAWVYSKVVKTKSGIKTGTWGWIYSGSIAWPTDPHG